MDPAGIGWTSLALGPDDRPHIAYEAEASAVKYAVWNGTWSRQVVGSWDEGGHGLSLKLDSRARPWIAYSSSHAGNTRFDLDLVHWNGTAWESQVVNPPGVQAGWCPSLALDSMDRPRIAYFSDLGVGSQNESLTYASWDGLMWTYQKVLVGSLTGGEPCGISMRLDSKEDPHVVYSGNGPLSYFSWNGSRWVGGAIGLTGGYGSLALDSSDAPHIAYHVYGPEALRYASRPANGTWAFETAASQGNLGAEPSLVLDAADVPHITFVHSGVNDPTPYYLYYTEKIGGIWMQPADVIDPTEDAGVSSLALDSHGLPHVAWLRTYNYGTIHEIRYAHVPWVDTAPPSSDVLPIAPYWNGNPVTAEATDQSGVANVTLWYRSSGDNLSWGPWTPFGTLANPPWRWSFPYPAGDGYYEFYSTAVDVAGNAEPPPPGPDAIAGYDTTPPVSSASAIVPYWHASSPLSVRATATDNLSGVASVSLWYAYAPDNATWGPWTPFGTLTNPPWSWSFQFPDGEGSYRFHTIARDIAGNVEGNKTAAEAVAGYRVPPDYAPVNPAPPSPMTVGISLPVSISTYVFNLGGVANTTATLAFYNASTPGSPFATFSVPPVPPGNVTGPFSATWTSPATPGTYGVAVDMDYGNALGESNVTNNVYPWTVNVVPGPVTTLVVGQPNVTASVPYVTSATPLSFSVLDPGGTGIRATRYRVDSGSWTDYVAPFSLVTEGEHRLEWYSQDNAGNVEAARSATVRVDDTPPVVTMGVGTPKYEIGGTFVTSATLLTLTALDGGVTPVGVASVEYRIDGGAWTTYASPVTAPAPDGPKRVEYRATDRLGNVAAVRNLTVIVDDTPPVTTPSRGDGTYPPGTTFAFSATDAGCGVARTKVRVDGGAWTTYATQLAPAEGAHVVRFRSVDHLNNTEGERVLSVTIAGAPPPPAPETNWKPLVAAVFTALLAVAGAWSARRAPWPSEGGRRKLLAFAFTSLPFVAAEAATGIISFATGLLAIPPLFGAGTAVDFGILLVGVAISVYRVRRWTPPK